MSITRRLYGIASAMAGDWKEKAGEIADKRGSKIDAEPDAWKERFEEEKESPPGKEHKKTFSQLEEDLHILGLKKGAPWEDVKKAYRRELKKYHADLHNGDAEKEKTAHEIMIIYNAAYERLEKEYGVN